MSHRFRPITSDDNADLVELWRASWTLTYGPSLGLIPLSKMLEDLSNNGVASMLPGTGERGYCVVTKERIDGTAIIVERGNTVYLWGMYVLPEQQRRGLGAALLAGVADAITMAQRVEIRVLETSPIALAFYRKNGFVVTGKVTIDLLGTLTEAVVMSAEIDTLRS